MIVLLIAILLVIVGPLFARTWRAMFRMLGLQGLLLAAIACQNLASHIDDIAVWVMLLDLALLRGLFVPIFLHRMVAGRTRSDELELIPSNLVFWGLALVITVTALWFGATIPPFATVPSLHLGVALTAVLLGLYVLALQTRPLGQVIAAITIENGVVLLELLLNHHVDLIVELALVTVFLTSIIAFGLLLRRLKAIPEVA